MRNNTGLQHRQQPRTHTATYDDVAYEYAIPHAHKLCMYYKVSEYHKSG